MSIKLLATAMALTLATAMAPVFGQVSNEEKSKVVKDAPGKVPSIPKSTAGKGTGGAPVPVTTEEKSKVVNEPSGKVPSIPKATAGKGTGGAPVPVTTEEKSKVVK